MRNAGRLKLGYHPPPIDEARNIRPSSSGQQHMRPSILVSATVRR